MLVGITDLRDPNATKHKIRKQHEHRNYSKKNYKYDFTLLEMEDTIELGPKARKICLPKPDVKFDNETDLTASGWGRTENDFSSHRLKDIVLHWVPHDICRSKFAEKGFEVHNSSICATAGYDYPYEGTCLTDVGGSYTLHVQNCGKYFGNYRRNW